MPELPEVETIKTVLKDYILNKEIADVTVNYDKILANVTPDVFKSSLQDSKILDVTRYGKILIIKLSKGYVLIHLRMEGKFKFLSSLLDKHSHIIFKFKDDDILIYHDVRKFGKMFYYDSSINIFDVYPLNTLGLEPFKASSDYLFSKIIRLKKPIKEVLLDQSILAGIGNIYADEILYDVKLHPLTSANKITLKKCQEIIDSSVKILNSAIEQGGSTIRTYQSSHGVSGNFQVFLQVYGKEGESCPRCNSKFMKIKVGGRGTTYCPSCQICL